MTKRLSSSGTFIFLAGLVALTSVRMTVAAVLKLRDKGNRYRLRIGTFRVLFVLAGDMIQVYAVKDRKEAYE